MGALNNPKPLDYTMGLSSKAINRLLIASLVATIIVGFTTTDAYRTAFTAILLSSLVGFIWVISTKETSFQHLGLNNKGIINALAFIISVVALSQYCIALWDSPIVGTYILSFSIVGTFWWTIDSLQPITS